MNAKEEKRLFRWYKRLFDMSIKKGDYRLIMVF